MKETAQKILNTAKTHISAIFFLGGFLFDIITLNRIDQGFMLIQQAVFLVLIIAFLHLEIKTMLGTQLPEKLAKYRYYILCFNYFGSYDY